MAHTANVETSYHGVSPTMLAPFGAFYFREHEFHEFHESKFAQVNFHAGKDLLIAYEFSRILPCGQKTGWHSCYLNAISKDISRMVIREIREIRVLNQVSCEAGASRASKSLCIP